MARGRKICPECSVNVGVRTHVCECGHKFVIKQKKIVKKHTIKKRGIKECPRCHTLQGVRTKKCKNKDCDYIFSFQNAWFKKQNKETDINWKELECGDKIKCIKNYGPFFVTEEGEKIMMGEQGEFIVDGLNINGIHAHGKEGTVFIRMKEAGLCENTGIYRIPHKIKLKKKHNELIKI